MSALETPFRLPFAPTQEPKPSIRCQSVGRPFSLCFEVVGPPLSRLLTRSAACVASLDYVCLAMSYCSSSASAFGLGLPQYGLSSSSYGLSTSLYGSPHSLPLSYPLSLHSAPFGYPTGYGSLAHQCVSCAVILLTSTATQWQPTSLGRFTRPTRTSAPARDPGSPLTPSDRTDMPAAPAAAAASLGRPPSTRRRSDTDFRRTPRSRRSTSLPCPWLGPSGLLRPP